MGKMKEKLSEGKRNIIASLIEEYDIQSAEDIQDALKDLLGGTIESMLRTELDTHLVYEPYERSNSLNDRNGSKYKKLISKYGQFKIDVPQDPEGSFEPKLVKKRQKDISQIEEKIISMYAKRLSTHQISDQIDDIYGFEISEGMVSHITDRLLPDIQDWQQSPLSKVYPIVFIAAVHFSVIDNYIIKKLEAYIILGINEDGKKKF